MDDTKNSKSDASAEPIPAWRDLDITAGEMSAKISELLSVNPDRVTIHSDRAGEVDDASFTVTATQLCELQLLVGAPVTVESSASDPAVGNWGATTIRWEPDGAVTP